MAGANLTLGGVTFADFEIPEEINFGGTQQVVVHKMIGGNRTVDSIGSDPADIEWSGRFRGSGAADRAQQVDQIRKAGLPVTLSWANFSYQVIVSRFDGTYLRDYEVPYRITCVIVTGDTPTAPAQTSLTDLVSGDLGSASSLVSGIQSAFADLGPTLTTASAGLSTASTALGALGTLSGKPTSQLASTLLNLESAKTALQGGISIADGNILTGAGQVGGVVAGNASGSAGNLLGQINAMQTLSSLVTARGLVGRTITNVSNAGSAP